MIAYASPHEATDFDDLIIGSGLAGLTVAALLANKGRRVAVLEAHDTPGGYAHSFRMKDYRFCAQVHYIFNCGEGETIHNVLSKLGLAEVPFLRLDPEGFDHVVVGGDRFRIPNGLRNSWGACCVASPKPRSRYDAISKLSSCSDASSIASTCRPIACLGRRSPPSFARATSFGTCTGRCRISTTTFVCRRSSRPSSPVNAAITFFHRATPATNERFCRAPEGNSYGAALTPRNVGPNRAPFRTSLDNLWMANATAGLPSVSGAMGAGVRLYEELTGDAV